MKKLFVSLIVVLMAVSVFAAKKNVILMIGDGMGINSVNQAEFYLGKDFPFTKWDTQLFATTYSTNCPDGYDPKKAWKDPEKGIPDLGWLAACTDSAAAATAIHSSIKTANGKVNVSPDGDKLYVPIGQYMKAMGYAVGSISTVLWCDATPSGPFGHTPSRGDLQVKNDMMINSIDVLGGSGHPYYDANGIERSKLGKKPSYGHFAYEEMWNNLVNGKYDYQFVDGSENIRNIAKIPHPKGKYYFALPNNGDLPYMKCGQISKNQYGDCPEDIITLREMAESALNVLKENEKGFLLMVEGGAIDHGNHGNNWEHSVCQMASFADAIEGVCKWVEKNSNWDETVLLITADHQTGGIINEDGTYWVTDNGKGNRPNQKYTTGGHTNLPVPVFVKGSCANNIWKYVKGTDPVLGKYIDNTDISRFFGDFVGFEFPITPTAYSNIQFKLPTLAEKLMTYKDDIVDCVSSDWNFILDPEIKGVKEKWFEKPEIFANTKKISCLKDCQSQEIRFENGEAWYYQKVTVPEKYKNKKYFYLLVNAADEEAYIYVNGKLAFDHSVKGTGKTLEQLWIEPFYTDIKKYGAGNTFDIVIRVGNEAGNGGLYKPVSLYASDREVF